VEDDRENFIREDGFKDTKGMKDEDTEETKNEGSNDEDAKKGAMLTNPDCK
jgi:hypothetical protein